MSEFHSQQSINLIPRLRCNVHLRQPLRANKLLTPVLPSPGRTPYEHQDVAKFPPGKRLFFIQWIALTGTGLTSSSDVDEFSSRVLSFKKTTGMTFVKCLVHIFGKFCEKLQHVKLLVFPIKIAAWRKLGKAKCSCKIILVLSKDSGSN